MKRKLSELSNDGVSPVIATLLLVTLTVILVAVVAAVSMSFVNQFDEEPPEILAIEFINSISSTNYQSNITVKNIGREFLWNSAYRPVFYINGTLHIIKDPELTKLNARGQATGLGRITGDGPNGDAWAPRAIGYFDLTNRAIRKGDVVQVDIIRNSDGKVISRSVRTNI